MWSTLLFVAISLFQVKGNLKDFILWDRLHSNRSLVMAPPSEGVLVCALVESEGGKVGGTHQTFLSGPCILSHPTMHCIWHLGVGAQMVCNTSRPSPSLRSAHCYVQEDTRTTPPIRICVHTALKCVPIDTCVWAPLNMLFGYNAYFSYFHCYSISTPTSAVEWWKLVCPACYGLLCEVMASCVM